MSKWRLGHSSNYFLVGNDTSGSKLYLETGQNYNDFYQLYADEDYLKFGKQSGGNWTECWRAALKSDVWPQNPGTQIAAGTDMQTITTPGHYYCENNNTIASLKNCPISDAFTLVVYRSAGGTGDNIYYVAQEYTSYMCNRRVIQTYNKDSKNWTTHEIQFKS